MLFLGVYGMTRCLSICRFMFFIVSCALFAGPGSKKRSNKGIDLFSSECIPDVDRTSPEMPVVLAPHKALIKSIARQERSLRELSLTDDEQAAITPVYARFLLHASLTRHDAPLQSLTILANRCSQQTLCDLIIEAALADRVELVEVLTSVGLEKSPDDAAKKLIYKALALGYFLAEGLVKRQLVNAMAMRDWCVAYERANPLYREAVEDLAAFPNREVLS